ncbi:MAG: hypothetical protein C4326_02780 [Ignavibacteria bacterium]
MKNAKHTYSIAVGRVVLLAGMILVGASGLPAQEASPKRHHTHVRLLADVESIRPGSAFAVGVLMTRDAGWHTYWQNSGEAGLPTQIEWQLPSGFTAGEIQWPLPRKYNESGEILTYGYENETMLLVTITPPNRLPAGTTHITLKAKVRWLECEKLCVPGSADVVLTLPVRSSAPRPAHAELFARYRAMVPQPLPAGPGFTFKTETRNSTVTLVLAADAGKQFVVVRDVVPDFYPHAHDSLSFGRTAVQADKARATLTLPVSAHEQVAGPLTMSGVLVYQFEGEEKKAGVVEIVLPREFCASIRQEGESPPATGGSILDRRFSSIPAAYADQPLLLYVLFAIIGGLLLNIMPCVLPVIGLKIFGLMCMAGDEPRRVRKMGWVFSLGILSSFLVLALLVVLLKTAGEQVGWGFQFQEPLFVIAMSTIVFAFGLSLFGVYEINVPLLFSVASTTPTTTKESKGYGASFSEGVFATILATPCTAPFLGSAMGFAFSQSAAVILLLFATVAFGMALPYLILTMKPNWMRFLPKPGEWMVTAKHIMGFLMMATLVWLLKILGSQLGTEAVVWTSAFLLCVAFACWLIGRFATLSASRGRHLAVWVGAVGVVVLGYAMFVGDVLKARNVLADSTATTQHASFTATDEGIAWQPFSIEKLEAYLQDRKPVFLEFTAEWCLTCKVNEKTVLADKEVVAAIREKNVIAMKADWTNRNETITRSLQTFGRSGVPLYVVFPAGKPDQPIVLPEVITSGIVLDALAKATGS